MTTINNQMREAFTNLKVNAQTVGCKTTGHIINSLLSNKGKHEDKTGWSASLSYRTYQDLKKQGVMS